MLKFDDIQLIAKNTYEELIKKYNITNCNLCICDTIDYIINNYNTMYKKYCNTPKRMYVAIVDDLYDFYGSFARAEYYKCDNDAFFRVVIPTDNIYRLLYRINSEYQYEVTDDELIEYIQLVIQHEIGHILHQNDTIKSMGLDEAIKYLNEQNENEFNDYLEFVNEHEESEEFEHYTDYDSQKIYIEKYSNMFAEASANKYVNIDKNRFYELELKVHIGLTKEYNML